MNTTTDDASWSTDIHDPDIVKQWHNDQRNAGDLSDQAFAYYIQELKDKSGDFDNSGMVQVFDTPDATVVKLDGFRLSRDREFALGLLDGCQPRDYEVSLPRSGALVRHLVNPSSYLLRADRSRVLSTTRPVLCENTVDNSFSEERWMPSNSLVESDPFWSNHRQWLPADVAWKQDGSPELRSYINNLHPQQKIAYRFIEEAIQNAIPLWNVVLSSLGTKRKRRMNPRSYRTTPASPPLGRHCFFQQGWDRQDSTHIVIDPEPAKYDGKGFDAGNAVNLVNDFPDGIQVIVKITTIELLPSSKPPRSESEPFDNDWHIEGMMNEHICAGAVLCYDRENLRTGGIRFRQRTDTDEILDLFEHKTRLEACAYCAQQVLGMINGDKAYQNLGYAPNFGGRMIAYPNVLQTRATGVYLDDEDKPGHCKMLTLLLVDPYIRILSTANVPPQQRNWWDWEVQEDGSRLGKLPADLFDHKCSFLSDDPHFMSLESAKEERIKREAEMVEFNDALDKHTKVFDAFKAMP
ncbi:hypothetical protein SLS58_007107 [Diplodia intermedia]|uniref:DUF4246 domain-containing protein n=1 Tax=Diplodia intermedia TaxID=856260 RepID=A0ABR3TLA6_9PEZI